MDMFAIHPYLIPSRLPPTFAPPARPRSASPTIRSSSSCWRPRSAAPRSAAKTMPIVYRFACQTKIPQALRFVYTHLGQRPRGRDAGVAQAKDYAKALPSGMPAQSSVAGMLIFQHHQRARRSVRGGGGDTTATADRTGASPRYVLRHSPRRREHLRKVRKGEDDRERRRRRVRGSPSAGRTRSPPDRVLVSPALQLRAARPRCDDGRARRDRQRARRSSGDGQDPGCGLPPGHYENRLRAPVSSARGTAETRFSTPFALGAADAKARPLPTLEPVSAP